MLYLAILALPVASAATVYPPRSTAIASAITGTVIVTVAFGLYGHDIAANPVLLACPLVVLASVTLMGAALGRSAVEYRSAAIVDPLTGMLSRVALEARVAELMHRAVTTGETASLIVGDIDHFKAINDRSGHAVGDIVLKDIAGRLVDQLRAFEPAYRLGGEEFLIVLAGVDVEGARGMAERLRAAVGEVTVEAAVGEVRSRAVRSRCRSGSAARWPASRSTTPRSSPAPTRRSTRRRRPDATASACAAATRRRARRARRGVGTPSADVLQVAAWPTS